MGYRRGATQLGLYAIKVVCGITLQAPNERVSHVLREKVTLKPIPDNISPPPAHYQPYSFNREIFLLLHSITARSFPDRIFSGDDLASYWAIKRTWTVCFDCILQATRGPGSLLNWCETLSFNIVTLAFSLANIRPTQTSLSLMCWDTIQDISTLYC